MSNEPRCCCRSVGNHLGAGDAHLAKAAALVPALFLPMVLLALWGTLMFFRSSFAYVRPSSVVQTCPEHGLSDGKRWLTVRCTRVTRWSQASPRACCRSTSTARAAPPSALVRTAGPLADDCSCRAGLSDRWCCVAGFRGSLEGCGKQSAFALASVLCWYGALNYRTAARTLFLRPYLAHFCSVFRHFFAVFSVLTPGFQKVAPKDRGAVP